MSNYLLKNEVEIDPLNSCLDDYYKFITLSSKELDTLQNDYSSELHKLQTELDNLLDELRSMIQTFPPASYLNCA